MTRTEHVWVATLSTRHFDFYAAGDSEQHAREAMQRTWEAHAQQTGADGWEAVEDGVNVHELIVNGEGIRQ